MIYIDSKEKSIKDLLKLTRLPLTQVFCLLTAREVFSYGWFLFYTLK